MPVKILMGHNHEKTDSSKRNEKSYYQLPLPTILPAYQVNIINAGFNSTGSAKCDTTVVASG